MIVRQLLGNNEVASERGSIGLIRQALAAGVALTVLASVADAATVVPLYGAPTTTIRPKPKAISGSKAGKSSKVAKDAKGKKDEPKGGPFGEMPKGPLQLVVSIASQHVTLYSNGVRVAQSPVSTGVPGHPTPTGVFSIIQKDRYHHSNLYSNAPMGVALHEGVLPASHGCILMSHDFAQKLWRVTKLGVRVFVARHELAPVDFAHPICSDQRPSRRSLPSPSAAPMDAAARRQS